MIAVSSHRPFAHSPEIARNQTAAFHSWLSVFDAIVYFGDYEHGLMSNRTAFVTAAQFPPIRLLMLAGALAAEPVCIINADIVLGVIARKSLDGALKRAKAAMSFRLEFDPARPVDSRNAKQRDDGIDLFAAHPTVWRSCWRDCPPEFRIGRPVWDSWLFMWMREHCSGMFANLSAGKFVFHPKHSR